MVPEGISVDEINAAFAALEALDGQEMVEGHV